MKFKKGDIIYLPGMNWLGYFHYARQRNMVTDIFGEYIWSSTLEFRKGTPLHWLLEETRLATPEDIAKVLAERIKYGQ